MKQIHRTIGLATILSVFLLVAMGSLGAAAASPSADAGEITVTLDPADQTVEPGETAAYDIVVEGATDGIGAYELTVELGDSSAATVEAYDHKHDPSFDNTEVHDDSVDVSAAMGENVIDGADETVLGTLTVAGEDGETDLAFADGADGVAVADESDQQYDVAGVTGGTLTVDWPAVDVGLTPADQTLDIGEMATYELVVEGATEGISAYETTVQLANGSVATVEAYEHEHDPSFDNTEVHDDSVVVSAAMGENGIEAGEEIVLGTLTVSGDSEGATALALDEGSVEIALDDDAVSSYETDEVTDGTLDVVDTSQQIGVGFEPLDVVAVGEVTLGVVVTGAAEGIEAYDIDIASNDTAVTVADYELTAEASTGPLDDSDIGEDGTTLSLTAALLEAVHEPAEEIHIANVTLDIEEGGSFAVEFGDANIQDLNEEPHSLVGEDLALSVSDLPPVGGDTPPQDLTGDGLHEDITGSGDLSIFDVQAFFEHLHDPAIQDNPEAFNFNGEVNPSDVNIFDVQGLFDRLGA